MRINPAMIMAAAAAMLARQMPLMFSGYESNAKLSGTRHARARHPKASNARHSQTKRSEPGYGACTLSVYSGIKKRMRHARRSA